MTRLDIFGHGADGLLILGDDGVLVNLRDRATWRILKEVVDSSLDRTQASMLRLLGCAVAEGPESRTLLDDLSKYLCCHVGAVGEISIKPRYFIDRGFDPKWDGLVKMGNWDGIC